MQMEIPGHESITEIFYPVNGEPEDSFQYLRSSETGRPMKRNPRKLLTFALSTLGFTGCSNDDANLLDEILIPIAGTVSLSQDVQPIFNANCALSGCHAGSFPQEGMSLEAPNIFLPGIGIVGVQSQQAPPGVLRVMPGNSNSSYLINKLEGTQLSVGGCCDQMPQGVQPLNSATIQVIRDWIDQGSQNN